MIAFLSNTWPVILAAFLYVSQTAISVHKHDVGMAMTYAGYAFAAVGQALVLMR